MLHFEALPSTIEPDAALAGNPALLGGQSYVAVIVPVYGPQPPWALQLTVAEPSRLRTASTLGLPSGGLTGLAASVGARGGGVAGGSRPGARAGVHGNGGVGGGACKDLGGVRPDFWSTTASARPAHTDCPIAIRRGRELG